MDGLIRLANAVAHFAAAKLEAHNDELAAIRAQFKKDQATIAGPQSAPAGA